MQLAIKIEPSHLDIPDELIIAYKTYRTPFDFQRFIKTYLKYLSDLIIKRVKQVVRRQLYSWSPLSPTWVAFKNRMGLSPKIWYASGYLIDECLHYWWSNTWKAWYVGVNPYKKHPMYKKGGIWATKKYNVLLIDIIRWLEFGTQNIPPRPLFSKVISEFKKKEKKIYQQFLNSNMQILKSI